MILSSHVFLIYKAKYCCCPTMKGLFIFGTSEIDFEIVQTFTRQLFLIFQLYFSHSGVHKSLDFILIVHDKRLSVWLHILSYTEMFYS